MGTSLISNGSASCPYEIGDGFWTKNTTPPSERWPGTTWEQLKDTFLLSSGDTYSIGQTGGEATHQLVSTELPSPIQSKLSVMQDVSSLDGGFGSPIYQVQSGTYRAEIGRITIDGGNQPHNNMPPYTVRSYWERTG